MSHIPSFTTLYDQLHTDTLTETLDQLEQFRHQSPAAVALADTLRKSDHVLRDDPNQLAGQLLGRLRPDGEQELTRLLDEARAWQGRPWLRPLQPTLSAPGTTLIRTLLPSDHDGSYNGKIALSADGRYVLVGTKDGNIVRWDVSTGQQVTTFSTNSRLILEVCATPDGSVMTALGYGPLQLWDVATSTARMDLSVHSSAGWQPKHALSPDGNTVLMNTEGGRFFVTDGRTTRYFKGYPANYTAFCFTPDGRSVFSATIAGTFYLWDVLSGETVHYWYGAKHWTTSVAVLPDGQRALCGATDGSLTLWHLPTGTRLARVGACSPPTDPVIPQASQSWIRDVAVSGDGRTIVTCADEQRIRVWQLNGNEIVLRGIINGSEAYYIALDYTGTTLVTLMTDRTLKVWDITRLPSNGKPIHLQQTVRMSAVGDSWYATVPEPTLTHLHFFALHSPDHVVKLDQHQAPILTLACSANGEWLASGDMDGIVRIWSTINGAHQASVETGETLFDLAVSNDGNTLLSWIEFPTLRVWDVQQQPQIRSFEYHGDYMYVADISADAQVIVAMIDRYLLCAWEQDGPDEPRVLQYIDDAICRLRLAPDGRMALVGTESGNLLVWDVTTNEIVGTLRGHRWYIADIAITPDNRRALSVCDDGSVWLWDLMAGEAIAGFTTDTPLLNASLSADGRQCVLVDVVGRCHRLQLEGVM